MGVKGLVTIIGLLMATTQVASAGAPMDLIGNLIHDSEVTDTANAVVPDSDLYVVIDRNPHVQNMKVYKDGQCVNCPAGFKVSTGREIFDIPSNFSKSPECSFTPTGDFKPQILRELNRSDTWLHRDPKTGLLSEGSPMWHSIFFNGGIATHEGAGNDAQKTLGPKTDDDARNGGSGGCVRMTKKESTYLFDQLAVQDPNCPKTDTTCKYKKMDPTNTDFCRANPEESRCTDKLEWPVQTRPNNAVFRVIDSRKPEDVAAIEQRCKDDTALFQQRKDACRISKIVKSQSDAGTPVDPAQLIDDTARSAFLKSSLAGMDSAAKKQLSYDCNQSMYYEKVFGKCMLHKIDDYKQKHPETYSAADLVIVDPNSGMFDPVKVKEVFKTVPKEQVSAFRTACISGK